MKRKLIIALLTTTMVISPMSVSAAEFTDGSSTAETQDAGGSQEDVELFTDDSEVAGDSFGDSSGKDVELFSDSAVEESAVETGTYGTQSTYQISVSGELILSETQKFVDLLNEERAKLGVHPLVLDKECMDISQERAIQGGVVFGHVMPNGQSYVNVYGIVSECAAGSFYGTAEDLLQNWKKSPSHWNILTSDKYTRFGFAIYHHDGVDNYFYGYANLIRDEVDDKIIPYTGPYTDQKVNNYQMSVMSKGLLMKSEESSVKIGETLILSPKFDVYDGQHGGAQQDSYEYGDGFLDDSCGVWESSNSAVATIDSNGNVKALKEGTAVIRFYVNGDRDKYYQNTVMVKGEPKGEWVHDFMWDQWHYRNPETGLYQGGWITVDGKLYHCVEYDSYFSFTYSKTLDGKDIELTQGRLENLTVAIDGVWYKFDKEGIATKLDGKPSGSETTKPGTPKLTGSATKYQYANLTWKKVANAKGYEIYGYNSGKKTFGKIATVNANVNANTLKYEKKIGYGRDGRFKIRAYTTDKNRKKVYSTYSNVVLIQTAAQAPKIASVKTTGSRTLTVNWKKSASADGYLIYRYIKKTGNYNLVKTVNGGNVTSYKNTGLVKGRTYYYKIKAYRILDNGKKIYSAFSAPVAAKCK